MFQILLWSPWKYRCGQRTVRMAVVACSQSQAVFARRRSKPKLKLLDIRAERKENARVYYHHLEKLNDFLKQERPELINRKGIAFHQDSAKHHTSSVIRQKLLQLEWNILSDVTYTPTTSASREAQSSRGTKAYVMLWFKNTL
ncbi:hypothetical protein TNCV_389711 [Trichonephila clavipes]|nr:hypothetical protein TNCV_389711 [Trichonephila clavipes]